MQKEKTFTGYQAFVIALLAILQFTIVLDFMILSPLGAILMPKLHISTSQFGAVVSAYAFSAGASGLLAAGFADKFDRKHFLLFFYAGFLIGTTLCALATSYEFLLFARIFTGLFGGVIGSVCFAIITDLFELEKRGRVMGFVQMAFGASQVLGLPIGLMLANTYDWHAPFWSIVIFGAMVGALMMVYLKPIKEHLHLDRKRNIIKHLKQTISNPFYQTGLVATILLATGGFMIMPFASAFATNNLGLTLQQLPILYLVTGVFSMIYGPFIGKLSDQVGKFKIFIIGTIISVILIAIYTNLGITPFWICIAINVVLFIGIHARIISASALTSAVPAPQDRGAYMSMNSAIQQISGGIASYIAGMIVIQSPNGFIKHYDTLGYVVIASMIVAIFLIRKLNTKILERPLSEKY